MLEFEVLPPSRDLAWLDLRARLARAAREIHFSAVASDAMNSAALLAIAGNLASLAISIPLHRAPAMTCSPVDSSTLLATQILQLCRPAHWQAHDQGLDD